jgi:hypothetical protein
MLFSLRERTIRPLGMLSGSRRKGPWRVREAGKAKEESRRWFERNRSACSVVRPTSISIAMGMRKGR